MFTVSDLVLVKYDGAPDPGEVVAVKYLGKRREYKVQCMAFDSKLHILYARN